jgi:hypothetical protein
VEKYYKAKQSTEGNTIRRMRFACWIPKATNTHSEYITLVAFPQQQWLSESASTLRHTYLNCLVLIYWPRQYTINLHLKPSLQLNSVLTALTIASRDCRKIFHRLESGRQWWRRDCCPVTGLLSRQLVTHECDRNCPHYGEGNWLELTNLEAPTTLT